MFIKIYRHTYLDTNVPIQAKSFEENGQHLPPFRASRKTLNNRIVERELAQLPSPPICIPQNKFHYQITFVRTLISLFTVSHPLSSLFASTSLTIVPET